jgi:hypothetical protein
MVLNNTKTGARFSSNAGIAIGPILFIVAILAILAAAIAAGSGSFTANTNSESDRAKAEAIIEIGDNLKIGMDRGTMDNNLTLQAMVVNSALTSNANELFSPTGGGIAPPSASLAGNAQTDTWLYPYGHVPHIGTTTGGDLLAVLNVSTSLCSEINNKAVSSVAFSDAQTGTNIPPSADVGNFAAYATWNNTQTLDANMSAWPTDLVGKPIGCLQNANTHSPGYFFYEVIAVQ